MSFYCVSLFSDFLCHFPTAPYYVVCFCHVPLSFSSVIFMWHTESVITIFFCHWILSFACVVFLSCAFVIFIGHSICQLAIYNQCVDVLCHFVSHVLLSFVLSFLLSFSSVLVFCRVVLSCSSVMFFCRLHLAF